MTAAETSTATGNGLREGLRAARLAEAAHAEAVQGFRDAKSLRLQVLKDELQPIIADSEAARHSFDLALVPGETPRLWIDLITSVVMEPDARTYRLVEEGQGARETLFETAERGEMIEALKRHMAHRIIARERTVAGSIRRPPVRLGYSTAALMFAWLSGFALGALILLIAVILLKRLVI